MDEEPTKDQLQAIEDRDEGAPSDWEGDEENA